MAEEGFFSGAGEEEKEMMRARCRREVFECSGVIPSQLVRKHLVVLSHQKTNNSLVSSSLSSSFEQRVMQTQERLLERCEKREEEDKEEDKEEEEEEEEEKFKLQHHHHRQHQPVRKNAGKKTSRGRFEREF